MDGRTDGWMGGGDGRIDGWMDEVFTVQYTGSSLTSVINRDRKTEMIHQKIRSLEAVSARK